MTDEEAKVTTPISESDDESAPRKVSKQFLYTTLVDLSAKVDKLGDQIQTLTKLMSGFTDDLGDVRNEARGMGLAVTEARRKNVEILTRFELMMSRVASEIKAAYRAGQAGVPLESIPVPADRDTEPPPPPGEQ